MNFSYDLCTLPTLTESTLLCSLQQRCKDELTESYVGSVLLSLGPSNKIKGPQFLPSFALSVLRSLAFSFEDQSILICGHQTSDNTKISYDLLSSVLTNLDHSSGLSASVLVAFELLDYLSSSAKDDLGRALVVITLTVNPANLSLNGASMSSLLLDTSRISHFKVFNQEDGIQHVESCLTKLGMDPWILRQVCLIFNLIQDLLSGANVTDVLNSINVVNLPTLPSVESLMQLLYAYLVRWIVCWINSNVFGPNDNQSDSCSISIINAPGFPDHLTNESSTLSVLVTKYANEVLHNLYCTRLFVWEQEQYLEEGIKWETVEVEFNQELINAFHQKGGLFEIFEMTYGDEMKSRLQRCCQLSGDSCFVLGGTGDRFALVHFTGENEYVIDRRWVDTNEVHMANSGVKKSLFSSSCGVLVDMVQSMKYSPDVLPGSESIDSCALTRRAKAAMDCVCDLITTSQPHFVFCFKPNKGKIETFNGEFVLSQLQQFKVLDIALIQSCGFPIRITHSNFLKNYGALLVGDDKETLSAADKCVGILDSANLKEWYVGKTMVMLKPWHMSQLDAALDLFNQSAKKLQRVFKQSIMRKKNPLLAMRVQALDGNPPSPPPRPSHTLSTTESHSPSPAHGDYDKASSPSNSPRTSRRKKLSWKKASPPSAFQPVSAVTSDLESHVWFQGKLSRDKAEDQLKKVQFDCFLIRESESRIGEYALSLRHGGVIKHFRIDTKHGSNPRYELYGAKRSFPSIDVLVDYYSHHCISSGGELLTTPFSTEKQNNPAPLKRKLSSIRRPKPSLVAVPVNEQRLPRTRTTPSLGNHSKGLSLDISDDSMAMLRRELEVEERIVQAARRMSELPTSNRRERQKRKQSLQQAQSRLLSLRQQFHTLQERKRFIETSMQNNV